MMRKIIFFFGFICLNLSNLSAQQIILDSLERLLFTTKTIHKRIDIINEISFAYTVVRPDTAWSIGETAYQEAKKIAYIKGMARAAYCKGSASFYLGNYDLDIQNTLESLRLYESINDKIGTAYALSGLGISYDYQGQYDLAMEYLLKASALAEEIGETRTFGVALGNLANVYLKKKNPKESLKLALTAEKVLAKFTDLRAYAYSLNAICKAYIDLGDYQKALNINVRNIEVCKKALDYDSYISALLNQGKIYQYLGNYPEAEKNFLEALAMAQRTHNQSKIKDLNIELANLSIKIGDYKQATDYFRQYALIKDTLLTEANAKNIAQMQNKYNIEKKEAENKLLRKQQEFNQLSLKQRFWAIISISGFLASVIIITIILYRKQAEKEKNNEILRQQNIEIQGQKQEIEAQAARLQELNHTKDKIFGIIGHDLRSPISSLDMLLTILISQILSIEEFMAISGELKSSVEHLNFTLNNLLQWAKTQMEGLHTEPKRFDMARLVNENFNFLNQTAQDKNIAMQNYIPQATIVWADPNHINLVLRNLISNAIKFTPKGGNLILQSKLEADFCEIAIRDTGVGMSAENIAKLFNKTSHFSTYGTANEKGTGLGLLLCQEMIEKNGGTIWAESEVGKGTTFKFRLPLQENKSL
jgi:two-component system, sensor histidine kinase and response regulator